MARAAAEITYPHPRSLAAPVGAVRLRPPLIAIAVVLDIVAVSGAYALGLALRFDVGLFGEPLPLPHYWPMLFATLPIWILALALNGLYGFRPMTPVSDEMRKVFHVVNTATLAVVVWSFLLKEDVSRGWVIASWVSSLVVIGATRLALRKTIHFLRARGRMNAKVLIVGANEEGRTIYRALQRTRWLGLVPVGFLTTGNERPEELGSFDEISLLGGVKAAPEVVEATGASAVIVAGSAVRPDRIATLYRELKELPVDLTVSAGALNVSASRLAVEPLDGLAVFSLRQAQLPGPKAALKRSFDVLLALLAVIVGLPVFVAIAIAVRLSGPGPIFYRQTRIGLEGRPFRMYKFRSMFDGADSHHQHLQGDNEADGLLFKIRDDPRVTPAGRLLRRWALDELPQFFNVLRGDMSLVGPRPPLPLEVERYDEWLRGRLKVKPGITGLWQTNGRHELTFSDYARYDLFYVENWSIALDLYILWKTIPAILQRRGSY